MTCEHPEDKLQPLAFNGVIDVDEWECSACGHWSVKDPAPHVVAADFASVEVFDETHVWKTLGWVPLSREAIEDMTILTNASMAGIGDALLPAIKSVSISMKDAEDSFSKLRDAMVKSISADQFKRLTTGEF